MTPITIILNGEPTPLPAGSTVAQLVESLAQPPRALATAVNSEFVPRESRAQHVLNEGDVVLTFQPITGG